jgi:uroporphyrinogen-III synthase
VTGLLILRPEPAASETAARAAAMGLAAVAAPIFVVQPLAWRPPDPADFDAILLTSANGARFGESGVQGLLHLTCYAVGEASAGAARAAGFADVRTGSGDGDAAVALATADGASRLLHLCGRERKPLGAPGVSITSCTVYAADALPALPASALKALSDGAIVLLHSPRAAAHFAALVDAAALRRETIALAAISESALAAAGSGWLTQAAAEEPRDDALLELAAKLCKTVAGGGTGTMR